MTTLDASTTIREFALMRLAMFARKRAIRAKEGNTSIRVNAVVNTIVRVMLHLAGFSLLTMAGFQWNIIAGLIVAGVSCFALSTLMTRNANDEMEARRAPDLRTGR